MTTPRVQHNCTGFFFRSFDAKKKVKGSVVLDSGCGDGYASRAFITHRARRVIAYDPNLAINPEYDHPDIIWSRGLPPFGGFDVAWSHHVIEHIDNPVRYLQSLHKCLNLTGELWLTCPNTAENSVFALGHIHNFTICNMIQCLGRAGFPTQDIRWHLTSGQLRIRIPKIGDIPAVLPPPFLECLESDKHFQVRQLPQVWRWADEE